MKNLLFILFFFCSFSAKSQITYQRYLDTTYELRYYYAGWNMYTTVTYRTTYFDGDTSINGNWYYKVYTAQLDSNYTTPVNVDTMLHGPSFWREDSFSNVLSYNTTTGVDDSIWKWGEINSWDAGDYYSSCQIQYVDSIYLGTEPLRRIRGADTTELIGGADRGIVEGVGQTAIMCGLGIEGNGWIACYRRNNIQIQFSSVLCGTFLEPVRTDTFTAPLSINQIAKSDVAVYPVPTSGTVTVRLPKENTKWPVLISDMQGRAVYKGHVASGEELHISAADGTYYLQLTDPSTNERFIKRVLLQK